MAAAFAAAALLGSRRTQLGLTVEQLADRTGLSAAQIAHLEAGRWPAGMSGYETYWLAESLHLDAAELLGVHQPAPIAALDVPAAAWKFRPHVLAALQRARQVWVDDSLLDAAPGAALPPPACATRTVALPTPPAADPHAGATLALSATAMARTTLADGPYLLAHRLGVPVGRRPLPAGVRGVALDARGWALVLLNSEMAPAVRRRSAAHLLGHLLAGDVTVALVEQVEDVDDNSIFSCAGTGAPACQRAATFAAALCGAPRRPGPRAARSAAGVCHDDLLAPGGDSRVVDPSCVLRRRVEVLAAGGWVPEELCDPERFAPDAELADVRHPAPSALRQAARSAERVAAARAARAAAAV